MAPPVSEEPSAFERVAQRELSQRITAGLDRVAYEYREALVLRFQEGMSLDEIAVVTGAPLGTVKSRVYRGLSALQPWLKGIQA